MRLFAIILTLFFLALPCDAQIMINSFRFNTGYVGPLDSYTTDLAVAGAMNKRLLSSYTGPLIRIRRSSDDAELDIGYESDGDLDTAAITAFVSGNSAYVVTLYDQSGNGKHATQSTAANQPRIVNAGTLDSAGMFFAGATWLDIASSPYTDFATSTTVQIVSRQTKLDDQNGRFFDFGSDAIGAWVYAGLNIYWDAPYPTARINYAPSGLEGVEKVLSFERESATSRLRVAGTVEHSGSVSGSISGTSIFRLCSLIAGGTTYLGHVKNFCVWKTANSTDCAARSAAMP